MIFINFYPMAGSSVDSNIAYGYAPRMLADEWLVWLIENNW